METALRRFPIVWLRMRKCESHNRQGRYLRFFAVASRIPGRTSLSTKGDFDYAIYDNAVQVSTLPVPCVLSGSVAGVLAVGEFANAQNLLANPGAEQPLAGWTSGGYAGVDNGSFDPGINPHSGSYDFFGGAQLTGTTGDYNYIYQNVNLASNGLDASSGNLMANYSFWVTSLNQGDPSDSGQVVLQFLDAQGGVIGTASSGQYYDYTGWEFINGSSPIPASTASIDYEMQFWLYKGTNVDAFIDDNNLSVTSVPEPSTLVLLGVGAISLLGYAWRRRRQAA